MLTSLTVLDAEIAIWITADARPEHVSTVSWLNENAGGADFYLVKVEGVKVDDSRPAPLFTRIVGPSPEIRSAEQTKKEWDERDRMRYRFFKQLLERTDEYTNRFGNVSPQARRSVEASAGPGLEFKYTVLNGESRGMLRIDFGKTQAVNDAAFEVFVGHRKEIESQVDCDLQWVQDVKPPTADSLCRRHRVRRRRPVGRSPRGVGHVDGPVAGGGGAVPGGRAGGRRSACAAVRIGLTGPYLIKAAHVCTAVQFQGPIGPIQSRKVNPCVGLVSFSYFFKTQV